VTFDREALRSGVTVADGGWSTRLQMRGLPTDVMAETANLTHPELVIELAIAYLDAGAQFITTNTFAANRYHLQRRAPQVDVTDVNRRGAELARTAVADRPALVAGAIGPTGKILAVKEVKPDEVLSAFTEQAEALAAGGADLIVLETFSELAEVLLALRGAKEATRLPVVASLSFDSGPQRTCTMMGARADECAEALEEAGADAVGTNCGGGIATALPAVVALRGATSLPLWVKPNAGLPELVDGEAVWRQTPEEFAAHIPQLVEAGANIIGGCCGSGPEHIQRVAAWVARHGD
jgi:methionine synthase I (cobalamin-dependent)